MNVLIQNESTGEYYGAEGQWVDGEKHAQIFNSTTAALHYCLERDCRDILLVVRFGNSSLNFEIAPFKGEPAGKATSYSAFAKVVVESARNLILRKQARKLWREIDSIINEGKERRKARRRFQRDGESQSGSPE
jgi:hypothetical protein